MRYQTSIDGDFAVIRSNRPAEVAAQLLAAADSPHEVRTLTTFGISFRVPLYVAEAGGFVDYPTDTGRDTGRDTGGDPAAPASLTGNIAPPPTGNPSDEDQGATGDDSSSPDGDGGGDADPQPEIKTPARNGSQAAWSEFLTEHGVEHDEQASRDSLIALWTKHTEG